MKSGIESSFTAMILAAGKGSRMQTNTAKAAIKLNGKPILQHVIENLQLAGCSHFIFVLGWLRDKVSQVIEDCNLPSSEIVFQEEQKGTAHAVLSAQATLSSSRHKSLQNSTRNHFLVVSADMPLISSQTFRDLVSYHSEGLNFITVLSTIQEEPFGYGRIIRNDKGNLAEIIEEKDLSPQQKQIQEVNTGTYVFESPRIFSVIRQIQDNNSQKEYYLPDAIKISIENHQPVGIKILHNPQEAQGINSPDELKKASSFLKKNPALSLSS